MVNADKNIKIIANFIAILHHQIGHDNIPLLVQSIREHSSFVHES